MRVVLDTNVWFSGLILPDSVPGRVLEAIRKRTIVPVASWDLAEEIARVLRRPRVGEYEIADEDVAEILAFLAPFIPSVEFDAGLRDPSDLPVVRSAVAGEADAIVTGDRDLLDDEETRRRLADRGIRVMTPRELLTLLTERAR
ncbi:MAG: putative toxin-antitoxin system toxin component, PIN family [Chloroflexi bacterium]|nr:putative toxin-antitoxin system toxin component, PIN family [Chloroflexota bacterium]